MKSLSFTRVLGASALSLAAMLTTVPAVAFAEDMTPSASTSAEIHVNEGKVGALRVNMKASASTTEARKAEMNARTASSTNSEDKIQKGDAHAGEEIDRRIESLNKLASHIMNMKLLPAANLATITASINTQISALAALKAKIAADTDAATLKADMQSIAKSYRIYLLVIPQDRITSASSRILAVATQMETLSVKFAARIQAAGSVDANVTSAKSDFDAKVADAKVQATAAVSLIAGLVPDNGDVTVQASNTVALKAAFAKITTAQQDLRAARKDAETIVKGVSGKGDHATATTTVEASTSSGN